MQVTAYADYKRTNIKSVLKQIPFFEDMATLSVAEFDALLKNANVIDLDYGEVLLKKGSKSPYFYVLLQGYLDVFGDTEPGKEAISQLTGSQILGALGTINNDARSATLAGARDEKSQVLAIEYEVFGELEDFSKISLATKLKLYRNIVNNTRWKLEMYKKESDDPTLEQELRLFPPFKGEKDTVEELRILSEHAEGLGGLLDCWNECAEASISLPKMMKTKKEDSILGSMKSILTKKVI